MASMSILINGSLTKPFHIEKGLRQGDPLSPFLFVLIADVLNCIVNKAVEASLVKGLESGKLKAKLTHLQFANGTICFCPMKVNTLKCYNRF